MLSARKILILFVEIFFSTICFAQRAKIDSLKKVLPSLHDSARVDCLNALAEIYLQSSTDTAKYCATAACDESMKINYIHGIAESLLYKGQIEDFSDNFAASEKLYGEAINWYRKTAN